MANTGPDQNASNFFITLTNEKIDSFYKKHTIIGFVAEEESGSVLDKINQVAVNSNLRPLQNIRIKHTVVIDDPFEGRESDFQDYQHVKYPLRSPSPIKQTVSNDLKNFDVGEIFLEDDIDLTKVKSQAELASFKNEADAKNRAHVLEILDDLPEADIEPPKNVLFVCKLNAVTQADDLEIIFSRFGKVKSCEVIRDWKTGDSLQYAFVEYETEDACIVAYSKMDGVLIDERRVKVDFSNSVAKLWNQHRRKQLQKKAQEILIQQATAPAKVGKEDHGR